MSKSSKSSLANTLRKLQTASPFGKFKKTIMPLKRDSCAKTKFCSLSRAPIHLKSRKKRYKYLGHLHCSKNWMQSLRLTACSALRVRSPKPQSKAQRRRQVVLFWKLWKDRKPLFIQDFSPESDADSEEQVEKPERKCKKVQFKGLFRDQKVRLGAIRPSIFGDGLLAQ